MTFADYKQALLDEDKDINEILDTFFHSGQPAVFAGGPPGEEAKLKNDVARGLFGSFRIRVHPLQLVVCGSAHLGFSPVPDKLGKSFDPATSDIDFAVISPELFDSWWVELQSAGLDEALRHTVSRDLFWGFINPANVRDIENHGTAWWRLFGGLHTNRAAGVRGRLYRNFWSMQSYHRQAVWWSRDQLLRERETQRGGR